MAVTVTFGFFGVDIAPIAIDPGAGELDLARLPAGGVALAYTLGGNTDLDLFGPGLAVAGGADDLTGVYSPAVAALTNGNVVVATGDGDSIVYTIRNGAGAQVLASTDLGDTGSWDPDVAGLAGGRFVIVNRDFNTSTLANEIDVTIRNANGSPVTAFTITAPAGEFTAPAVAALDNGNFAVVWHQFVDGTPDTTAIWHAVYSAAGAVIRAPAPIVLGGDSRMAVTATDSGYVLAFEYEDGIGQSDVLALRFDMAGALMTPTAVAISDRNDGVDARRPSIDRMPGDAVVIAYSRAETDTLLAVLGRDNAVSQGPSVSGGRPLSDVVKFPALARYGTDRFVVAQFDQTVGQYNSQSFRLEARHTGDSAHDLIHGSDLSDHVFAGGGNDTVYGGGQANELFGDELFGEGGDDQLNGGGGDDLLIGDFSQSGTGNDTLDGGEGRDLLYGAGGTNLLIGGPGDDDYVVDTGIDTIVELAGGGKDEVATNISFSLASLPHVENLVLVGTANARGTGNDAANAISGNGANNVLRGYSGNDTLTGGDGADDLRGMTGNDSMIGGLGSDIYQIDSIGDRVSETTADFATGGNDAVYSQISYTLGANVERLFLQTAGNLNGTGNGLSNRISGNSGANLLQGLGGNDRLEGNDGADTLAGGAGNDTLTGGSQADVFRFTTTSAGADFITDFNKNADRFDLGGGSFTQLTVAPDGDVILRHNGGTIRIDAPLHNLTLAQYNALVLPSGSAFDVAPFDAGGTNFAPSLIGGLLASAQFFALPGHFDFLS